MAVRIAVVDPLPMFQQGVVAVLSAVGHDVETPADVVGWARRRGSAVVLLTVLSESDWDLLAQLCATATSYGVIALLDDESVVLGTRAMRAGARSVLPRGVTVATLQRTVEAMIGGQAVMPSAVAAALAADTRSGVERSPSAEQLSWLRQLAAGSTVAQLADRAGYSERAMFRLLNALYRQIGAGSRIQAIMRAQEAGWL
ncbi:DNA-binding response regulator [Plantactinospora sp. BC1]|uniref:response regulator transcription factor n=1 Tax=Plantactinospora sp. BC1 TaxID=2108470 RepID=UPI000D1799C0|nr:response regulator transcription factor [Plantactinospora sp. BC1]AVT34301.1 DNA-binding response regulator [Plantactinospora sp. BC1]